MEDPRTYYGATREQYLYTGQELTRREWRPWTPSDPGSSLNAVSTYTYDGAGDLAQEVHADYVSNVTTTVSYNWTWQSGAYRLTTFTAANGVTTTFDYDSAGRISRRYTTQGYSDYTLRLRSGHAYEDGTDWLLRETWHAITSTNVFDLVRYWYVNGRPSRMEVANVSADLQTLNSYSVTYIQYNWHGDAVTYVSLDGAGASNAMIRYDPWGNAQVAQSLNYHNWNGGWGYLLFSYLGESYDPGRQGLYYIHGRWYSPDTGMYLSPDEKGDYIYGGDGPDAVNWAWFLYGFNCRFYSDISLGLYEYQNPVQTYKCEDFAGNEFFIGQWTGRSLSNLAGGLEFLLGGGLTFGGGGVTIGSGGTLSIVSVPTALGGIATLSHGTAILVRNTLSPPPILYAKGKGGQPSGSWRPSGRNWTQSEQLARQRLGLTDEEFREAIHDIKKRIPGNLDMWFNLETGDVHDPRSGELVGNLLDYR